jgi:hypothetical protein
MITTASPIRDDQGTIAEALAFLDHPDAEDVAYVNGLFDRCQRGAMSFAIAFGQFCVETANGTSPRWLANRNPAGLLVSADGDPDPAILTGDEAAHAHTWALAYALYHSHTGVGMKIAKLAAFYDRWQAKYDAPECPTVRTVADLCRHYTDANGEQQSTWAWDATYADQIAAKANAIFKRTEESSMPDLNMTKGLIPLPTMEDDIIDVSARAQGIDCRGYDWLGTRPETPKFLVIHRAQCPPDASNSGYFHQACCPALTDLEVNCVTGHMKRFVRRGASPSGWANGVVNAPYGDALAWLNLHAWDLNSVNRDGEACEVSGWFLQPGEPSHEDPVADPCWASLAQWIASRAHDYGISYLDFPVIPSEGGRSYITWHQEWTIGTGKVCPGKTVMDGTPALIERARAIIKQYQEKATVPVPTPEPTVPTVPWKRGDVGHKRIGTVPALAFVIEVTASKDAPVRVAASAKKDVEVIVTIPAGKTGVAIGGFISGGRKWLIVDCGAKGMGRALASDFHEVLPMP